MAPTTAMFTDSHRIIARSWTRDIPLREQSQLVGALEDRQGQRVDDAEDGDDDGEAEQHGDERQDHIDLALGVLLVPVAVIDHRGRGSHW